MSPKILAKGTNCLPVIKSKLKPWSFYYYYYYQNPSGFCFLVQIWAFVILNSLGLPNLNIKEKTK